MATKNYDTLFYPFTKCFDSISLKRALLYFDHIHFINPLNLEEQENLIATSHYYDAVSLEFKAYYVASLKETYELLLNEGIIVNADIYPLIQKYDKELTANTHADISDKIFCNYSYGDISTNVEKVTWHILEKRMPPSLLHHMREVDWKTFRHEIAKSGVAFTDTVYGGKYLSFIDEFSKLLPTRKALQKDAKYTNSFIPLDKAPIIQGYGFYGGSEEETLNISSGYIIPYAYGASISISQAMLYAALNNLILFTDSETMHYLLARKCQIAFESLNNGAEKLKYVSMPQKIKESDLVIGAIDAVIPEDDLKKLSFADVIKLRKAFSSQLNEFREYISELNNISSAPWETSYHQEVQEVKNKIKRDVKKLQSDLSSTYQKIFRSTLQSLGGIGIGIAIMPHNLTVGSVIALLAAKDIPLDPIFKVWEAQKDAKQHSTSYLINIQRTAKRKDPTRPWNNKSHRLKF